MISNITFYVVAFVIFVILIVKNGSNKKLRKMISALIITVGIFIATPWPDFGDIITIPMYNYITGIRISSVSQFADVYFEYTIITLIIGIAVIMVGLWIEGHHPSTVIDKLKKIFKI